MNDEQELKEMKSQNSLYCIEKKDQFGSNLDLQEKINKLDFLSIIFRPCIPTQRTELNKDTGTCLVNDLSNKTEMEA